MTSVRGNQADAGAGTFGGCNRTAPAQFQVGCVGFGPAWSDDEPSLREMYDSACRSIVRLECALDEANARIALLEEEQKILARPKPSLNCCESCGVAWADHLGIAGTCKALQDALQTIESLRDTLCSYKCADKASADRGWANI